MGGGGGGGAARASDKGSQGLKFPLPPPLHLCPNICSNTEQCEEQLQGTATPVHFEYHGKKRAADSHNT